jgi:hypothetical protein
LATASSFTGDLHLCAYSTPCCWPPGSCHDAFLSLIVVFVVLLWSFLLLRLMLSLSLMLSLLLSVVVVVADVHDS